jgi:tripartite-type tricarboxylate transporter receptor subunit TctC
VVAPFPPGQGTELIARQLSQELSTVFGQNFYVDNKPGAAGIIGTQIVQSAAPDGYTLLVAGSGPLAINASLYRKLPYDPLKDFRPIRMIGAVPNVLVVRADLPVTSLQDVVAYVKANAGKLNYASSGSGVPGHLIMEMLKARAGLDIVHVPYKGAGASLTALMGGEVAMMFETAAAAIPHVQGGRIKIIATAGARRALALPNVPTIAESGFPDFAAQGWSALVAPAATPAEVIDRLSKETGAIMAKDEFKQRLIKLGVDPLNLGPEEASEYMKSEVANWAKAVKLSGAQAD